MKNSMTYWMSFSTLLVIALWWAYIQNWDDEFLIGSIVWTLVIVWITYVFSLDKRNKERVSKKLHEEYKNALKSWDAEPHYNLLENYRWTVCYVCEYENKWTPYNCEYCGKIYFTSKEKYNEMASKKLSGGL